MLFDLSIHILESIVCEIRTFALTVLISIDYILQSINHNLYLHTGTEYSLPLRYKALTFYGTLVITEFTGKWFLSSMHSGMPLEI